MPHHHLYYHLVWGTKERHPLISSEIEPDVYQFIAFKVQELKGRVFAIGGIEDHVHVVASIPPTIAVAQFIGKVKGHSSHQTGQITAFRWQTEYGAYSVGRKQLKAVIAYVRNQKKHHAEGTTVAMLERWE